MGLSSSSIVAIAFSGMFVLVVGSYLCRKFQRMYHIHQIEKSAVEVYRRHLEEHSIAAYQPVEFINTSTQHSQQLRGLQEKSKDTTPLSQQLIFDV